MNTHAIYFPKICRSGLVVLFLVCGLHASFGQWITQTITLNPGWNAVFLDIQPANPDCDTLFAGIPVESVWAWNRRYSSVQFIQDPSQLVPGTPDWLIYFPSNHPARATRNLFSLQGARPYLVKLKSGAATTAWSIAGQPIVRIPTWLPDSYNFVGFPLGSGATPTFQDFFSGSAAHTGQPIYRLNSSGQWSAVSNPAGTAMNAGEGFWIYCKGASTFSGPLQLTLQSRDGLLYGDVETQNTLRIMNNSSSVRTFSVQELSSLAPPGANFPLLAGAVPLSYYNIDAANRLFGWFGLPNPLQKLNLQPGQEWVLRLEVNRNQMAPFVPPATNNGVLYQSVLQISDNTGARLLVPVSSQGLINYGPSAAVRQKKASSGTNAYAGLWVGSTSIDKVSQPDNLTSPTVPLATGSPLQFRLLIHLDDNGNARVLQKVLEMFKPATLKPDPNNPSNNIVDQPGHYVLVTDDSLIPQFTGATLRDSDPVARRLSSAAFGFPQPILLSPNGAFGSGSFTCQVNLDYDDRMNPFKHLYHPQHDNLDDRFQNKLPEGVESFTVRRQIELDFTSDDPDNLTLAGWGDDQLGGIYKETISGLHNQSIYIAGTFRITRASTIGILNDGH
jgi:hypothetical protein